jgi:hypothetical protein
MTVIELPDEQAEALKAKAAAQGLTLEAWLEALAAGNAQPRDVTTRDGKTREAAAGILDLQKYVKPDPEGWTIRDYIDHGRA